MKIRLRHMLGGGAIAFVLRRSRWRMRPTSRSTETGSTLLYPLFQSWIAGYKSVAPDVDLTAAATGSGAGNQAAIAGTASIGASDAYLSDEVAAQNPNILDIPLAISAQTINYNLPGLNGANIKTRRPDDRRDLFRRRHAVGRSRDQGDEPGRDAPAPDDHSGPPCRGLRRHLHLHPVPGFFRRELGRQSRLRQHRLLARRRRGKDRDWK